MSTPSNSGITPPLVTTESAILGALNFPALIFDKDTQNVTGSNRFFNSEQEHPVGQLCQKYEFTFLNFELIGEIISSIRSGQNYLEHKLIHTPHEILTYAIHASLLPNHQHIFLYLNLLSSHSLHQTEPSLKQQVSLPDVFRFNDPKYKLIASLLPFGFYRTTEQGSFLYANSALAQILKYESQADLCCQSAFNLYPNPGERLKMIQSWKSTGINTDVIQLVTKTGELIWVRNIGWKCLNDAGELEYLEGIIEDVSIQRAEAQKVQEQSVSFKEMIQNIEEGLGQMDDNYTLTFCNKAFASFFCCSPEEMIGENLLRYFDPDNKIKFKEELSLGQFRINSNFEIKISREGQSEKIVQVHAIPRMISNNKYTGTLLLLSDLTDRISIEHDLFVSKIKEMETEQLKAAFLANVSHEIRTPMNSILGFSSILKGTELPRTKRNQYLDIIISHGKNLMDIINDIIDLSIIEENQLQIDLRSYNLNELFSEAYQMGVKAIESSGKPIKISVHTELPDDRAVILTDGNRIRQILRNLMNNALKFTEKGMIELGYHLENNETLVCYIKDTGIGVPPELHEIIFEGFRQADESFTRMYGGMGVGLTICRGLIEMLGGKIWVESEGIHGSTFYFTHPYYPHKRKAIFSTPNPGEKKEFKWSDKKILLIEDDPASSEYLTEVLTSRGCNVLIAENGFDAITQFKTDESINLILLDIQLPEMDGYEVARTIRKLNSTIPIIAQTAHSMAEDRRKCIEAGCNEYLTKPIPYDSFLLTVQKYIEYATS